MVFFFLMLFLEGLPKVLIVYILCTLVYLATFSNFNIHSLTYQKKEISFLFLFFSSTFN